jgi:hypothetical protein
MTQLKGMDSKIPPSLFLEAVLERTGKFRMTRKDRVSIYN